MSVFMRMLLVLGLGLALAACVTETTGGFHAEKSDKQALADYIKLARGYLDQGDIANAKRHIANAEALDRNNAEIYSIKGLVYAREGEVDLADQNFRRSLRIDGKDPQTRNNYAAFLFANNRFEDAYKQLQVVVQDTEYPARSQAFENLGLAALRIGRDDDALEAFMRALQLNPNQLRSSLELATLYLNRNDMVQATNYYRSYLTLLQFNRLSQNARSLLLGIRLEKAAGNDVGVRNYAALLKANFANTPEYKQYLQMVDGK